MTRFAMLASTAMLISFFDVASARPFHVFDGEFGGARNIQVTIDIADGVTPQTPVTNSATAGQVSQKAEEQLPLPSAEESATPRTLADYFCRMWRDEDYKAMYYCMSKGYRSQVEFAKFAALFALDAERTGGLDSGVFVAEDPDNAAGPLLLLDLKFMKKKMPTRRVKAVFEKTKDGYRLVKSGILPVDFSNL